MKKILALSLVIAMLSALCCVGLVANAEETKPDVFFVTHYNDGKSEGAGAIFTEEDTAGGWWLHVAFAPVEDTNSVYEVTQISNGLADGEATALEVPDGGFVWAANYGNNYPAINADGSGIDYTNDLVTGSLALAATWSVGDRFVIAGVDFENIPTSTPDTLWYEDGYVCTATIVAYDGTNDIVPDVSDDTSVESSEAESSVEESSEVDPMDEYKATWEALIGEAVTDPTFNLDLTSTVDENGIITVTVSVVNVKEGASLESIEADIFFDDEKLELVTPISEEDNSLQFEEDDYVVPSAKWEFISNVDKDQANKISFRACVVASTAITADGQFSASIQFKLKDDAEYGAVVASNAKASKLDGKDVSYFYGNGDIEIADVRPADTSSEATSEPVTPGDAGILVFAVLGVVAIAGAAVVIKVRH